ncbi:hypothetical protein CYMTET_4974 [Cymbomonas tetramitiformis]|uniref:Reverse transcriptase domain-containing protein n=1 Tax=Cymbomonas tetramitiformis TaxID=36881 RepID=A0AAE0H0B8_9CHLO|nr:hypothetical protein CYMTET_4974 [Cymbomonas tetramitiformis]
MAPKPGQPNTLRLVVDYRQLNSQTVRDRYPLPDIQLMFDEMQGATHFSSFNAVDGFWQIPMAVEDVEKTAFTIQMGSYEWLVMPQGLQNSPSQYQRRMQRALGHLPFVRIFIDDVVVFSKGGVQEHCDNVRIFLQTCREKGVYLKASKAHMLKESLRFLGHTLSVQRGLQAAARQGGGSAELTGAGERHSRPAVPGPSRLLSSVHSLFLRHRAAPHHAHQERSGVEMGAP